VAHAASLQTAVVHPLVEIKGARRLDASGAALISRLPWQRRSFVGGNYIDAMALIRTQAWRDVGGYSHIQGGWEDFDFWCKLIGAGYHGVLCPRVLARYAAHDESMTARSTSRQWRPLSRCLQQRHPWLRLPYAL
jgi:GT2 family glycosyltransferase